MSQEQRIQIDTFTLLNKELEKQRYHLIGGHSAYKKCHWTHEALTSGRYCYKGKFYGIESHRCVQMTTSSLWCWFRCVHCWRLEPEDVGIEWDETKMPMMDDPDFIAEKSIEEHRRSLSGYFGREGIDRKMLNDATKPKHVAISLTGEPTLYDRIGELIREYHKRGMTTFLVTSGVRPDVLASLDEEPTQLFVSLQAPNERKHKLINRSIVANSWNLFMKTLSILPSFSSPTVLRLTLMKGMNMGEEDVKDFAKLVEIAQPTYIEAKAYMHVGPSTLRLTRDAMPRHDEVRQFSRKLAELTGYRVLSEHPPSRIVLLSRLERPFKIGEAWTPEWNWKTPENNDDMNGEYKSAESGCTEAE